MSMTPMENQPPPNLDAWKHQTLTPLLRNDTRDDFKARESLESNPANYVVEIFPSDAPEELAKNEDWKKYWREIQHLVS